MDKATKPKVNAIQFNIYQALLGATYYKHWTLSLLEGQEVGILSPFSGEERETQKS